MRRSLGNRGAFWCAFAMSASLLGACSDGSNAADAGAADAQGPTADAGTAELPDSGPNDAGRRDARVRPGFPAPIGEEATGDPALGVGTGRDTYLSLRHGDTVRWEAGVQGGHHIWVSARIDGGPFAEEQLRRDVHTHFVLKRRDGSTLGEVTRVGRYFPADGGWELVGSFSVLTAGLRPSRLDGEPLQLSVAVTLPEGDTELHREVWVRSQCCD